jgi:3-methylfumaryl-CoA hydratase
MGQWDAWIGRTQEQSDILTPGLLKRFRATINSDEAGDIAPQGIHWCLCLPEAATAELGDDGHPNRGGFMPPIPLPRRMWAASDVTFHAPFAAKVNVVQKSTIAEISEKQGSSGPLVFVTLDHETWVDSALVISERQSVVYREAPTVAAPISPTGDIADLSGWAIHRSITPSEPLLFRYSALTFNSHRIHYDQPYATGVEGYRGLVVHGPLIATLLLDLAALEFGGDMIKKFSMRAQSAAFVGEPLHLVGKNEGQNITLAAIGNDGRTVMSAETSK